MDSLEMLMKRLPAQTAHLAGTPPRDATELRIRAGQPIQWITLQSRFFGQEAIDAVLLRETVSALADHSLYAREKELQAGYFTLQGGCRVGVCGRLIPDQPVSLGEIGSVNIRIAREIRGAANGILPYLRSGGRCASFLILSPPGMGKTTMLRDAVRQLSDGGVNMAIADERGELAACDGGIPMLDVGRQTDVLDGCPKARAIPMLLRAMSPDMIAMDELGALPDADAVRDAARCGVAVAATCHAGSLEEAKGRMGVGALIREGIFARIIHLAQIGRGIKVYDSHGNIMEE